LNGMRISVFFHAAASGRRRRNNIAVLECDAVQGHPGKSRGPVQKYKHALNLGAK